MNIIEEKILIPCLLGKCNSETRKTLKERYRYTKKYGLRAGFAAMTGNGIMKLIKEAATDGIKRHEKRYLGMILFNSGVTCISGSITILTNSTKVLKYAKACHSTSAAAWRVCHNAADFPLLAIDFLFFGEPVPSCGEADYDIFGNETDIFSAFTD